MVTSLAMKNTGGFESHKLHQMKYSENFERDYELYLRLKNVLTFCGTDIKVKYSKFQSDENGRDAKECFYILDSTGKYEKCKELDLLFEILRCKASINWQIKQWAEGRAESLAWVSEDKMMHLVAHQELKEIQNEFQFPDWVITAIVEQANKILQKKGAESLR